MSADDTPPRLTFSDEEMQSLRASEPTAIWLSAYMSGVAYARITALLDDNTPESP